MSYTSEFQGQPGQISEVCWIAGNLLKGGYIDIQIIALHRSSELSMLNFQNLVGKLGSVMEVMHC